MVDKLCSRAFTAEQYAATLLHRIEATKCLNAWAAVNASKVRIAPFTDQLTRAQPIRDLSPSCHLHLHLQPTGHVPKAYHLPQALEDARAVDADYASGKNIKPLCGVAFAVKDNIDAVGYETTAGNKVLEGADNSLYRAF